MMFDEFLEAVTNNPCCTWIKPYFYEPHTVSTLAYSKYSDKPDQLQGKNIFPLTNQRPEKFGG
jgi:hypothetical protein